MAELGCQNSNIPEPLDIKFGMGDYVADITRHAKIHNDRPSRASQQMGEISLLRGLWLL